MDFEVVETAARRLALEAMGKAVSARLNADRSDEGEHRCGCAGAAVYVERREKTFTTALGSMTLERAWYHCPACGRGFSPRDRALGLENASLSPAVRRMVGIAAGETSFGHASAALRELAGLEVGAKQVERHAEALGRDIARDELEVIDPEPATANTLYVGLDGTGVPMRKSETAGRVGKQADGSAKTREVKLVTVWSAERRDKDGSPCRDPGSGSCNGAIESIATRDTDRAPSLFAKRVLRELERRCVDLVARRVVLGDGAPWIWNFADEHLPDAVQIVDIFHAKQHIFDVAKAIYGPGSDLAAQWGKTTARRTRSSAAPIPSSPLCGSMCPPATRRGKTSTTSPPIANAWPIRRSAPSDCASPPASSKAPASPSSATASSAAACIGPSLAPMPSSPCDAPSSATASTTTGSVERPKPDRSPQI